MIDWLTGGGKHVGVDGAPIISLGQTGKNDKYRLSLFANWIVQHFVSGVRIRAFLTHVHHGHDIPPSGVSSFCGKTGKCKLKKWIVIFIYILRISRDVFLFSFFSTAPSPRSLSLPRPHPLVLAANKSTANFQDARKTPWSLKGKYSICIQKRL